MCKLNKYIESSIYNNIFYFAFGCLLFYFHWLNNCYFILTLENKIINT